MISSLTSIGVHQSQVAVERAFPAIVGFYFSLSPVFGCFSLFDYLTRIRRLVLARASAINFFSRASAAFNSLGPRSADVCIVLHLGEFSLGACFSGLFRLAAWYGRSTASLPAAIASGAPWHATSHWL